MLPVQEGGDRRRFLKLLALVGLSAAVDAPSAMAQAARSAPPAPPAKPDTAAAAAPTGPPVPGDDAKALAGIVQRRYGKHLTDAQLGKVAEELEQRIRSGRALRDVKLANGEEPDTVFRA